MELYFDNLSISWSQKWDCVGGVRVIPEALLWLRYSILGYSVSKLHHFVV